MSRFRRVFRLWFLIALLAFALANVAGLTKPARRAGFPLTVTAGDTFDPLALLANAAIGVAAAAAVALFVAWKRTR